MARALPSRHYTPRGLTPVERIYCSIVVDPETRCWNWRKTLDRCGYGKAYYKPTGAMVGAHRLSWVTFRGEIPEGLELDHLCVNPACVNPDHLEPVTPRENTLRSRSPAAINARKTHCNHGHEFNEANTRIQNFGARRVCRKCDVIQTRAYRERIRAQGAQ